MRQHLERERESSAVFLARPGTPVLGWLQEEDFSAAAACAGRGQKCFVSLPER